MDPPSAPAAPVAVVVKELSPAETLGLVAEDVHVAPAPEGPCWKQPLGCVCCPRWPCWKASLCALSITAVIVVAVLALVILFVVEVLGDTSGPWGGHGRPFIVDGRALAALPTYGDGSSGWCAAAGEL